MEKFNECPMCGSKEIVVGKFDKHTTMRPINKFFTMGSLMEATICTNCGHILSMKVIEPQKFK